MLLKWNFYRIFCQDLFPPHSKFCLCVCPINQWFLFINENPTISRKAKAFDLVVDNFRLPFLVYKQSYLPTGAIKTFTDNRVQDALQDERNHLGPIPPSLKREIVALIEAHPMLEDNRKKVILAD